VNAPLRVGSLFSGIGGFDLGLERTGGFTTAWFCEQDEFCQRVLARHWPGVPCHPDITKLTGSAAGPVEVLCGGFPCQDLSYAGAGAGLAGARSGLWSEYARLVGEFRPRYVVVENVSALLARGLGTVLADLAALGYDAEWDCIPASAVGAPHQRDRIWLVAYPGAAASQSAAYGAAGSSVRAVPDGERRSEHGELDGGPEGDPADGDSQRAHADRFRPALADPADLRHERPRPARHGRPGPADGRGRSGAGWWEVEPDVGRVADGVPARVDRLRSLGNALVPQIAEWIGRRILDYEGGLT
jgi:DNA (cytosine-5)-methyltransferase 1